MLTNFGKTLGKPLSVRMKNISGNLVACGRKQTKPTVEGQISMAKWGLHFGHMYKGSSKEGNLQGMK